MQWLTRKKRQTRRGPAGQRKPVDPKAAHRAFWTIAGLICLLLTLWVLFAPGAGVVAWMKAKQELADLQQKNAELAQANEDLREDIIRLKTDEAYLEKVARHKYGLLKKDERVYDFNRERK